MTVKARLFWWFTAIVKHF